MVNNLYWELSQRTKPAKWKGKWASDHAWDVEERLNMVLEQDTDRAPYRGAPYDVLPDERIQVRTFA